MPRDVALQFCVCTLTSQDLDIRETNVFFNRILKNILLSCWPHRTTRKLEVPQGTTGPTQRPKNIKQAQFQRLRIYLFRLTMDERDIFMKNANKDYVIGYCSLGFNRFTAVTNQMFQQNIASLN